MNLLHEQISALAKELRLPNLPDLWDACAQEAVENSCLTVIFYVVC